MFQQIVKHGMKDTVSKVNVKRVTDDKRNEYKCKEIQEKDIDEKDRSVIRHRWV